jgi:predicted homoserine dehydrogenase-like protein
MLSYSFEFRYNVITRATEYRLKGKKKKFLRLNDYVENSIFRMLHTAGEEIPLSVLHAILTSDFSPETTILF